jgi:2-dehydropantoate 2-reductase
MKFAIYGAGATGSYLGAKLSLGGSDVALVARGTQLNAIKEDGIRVQSPTGALSVKPYVTDDPRNIGIVDFIFLTVKAHSLTDIATNLSPLLGTDTAIVSAQNGIPWWYFQMHGGRLDGSYLQSVDPNQSIANSIRNESIVGCIVYPSTEILSPGVVRHIEGDRFPIGELDGSSSDRCKKLSRALIKAGLRAPIRPDIRTELWAKLMGNIAFNPLSALTKTTLYEITEDRYLSEVAKAIMHEAETVAEAISVKLRVTVDQRFSGAKRVGEHKTSMLQDLENGRRLELDSIVGAVLEIGGWFGIPMPYTQTIYACLNLLTKQR